jgi:hypothetical protein
MKNIPEGRSLYWCSIVNNEMVYQHDKQIGDNSVGYAGHRPDATATADIGATFGTSFVTGFISSMERLDTVLRNAERISVSPQTDKGGDSKCYVITADTKYGRYRVWLDPEHGYHPAKIQYRAGEGDFWFHHPLIKSDDFTNGLCGILRYEQADV